MASGVEWNGNKNRGEVVPPEVDGTGSEWIDMDNRVFFDMTAVAPAPSRDFYRLRVTKDLVELMVWKISYGAKSSPTTRKRDLQKFAQDRSLTSEVVRVFGQSYLEYIIGLSEGKFDWLSTLPNSIIVKILHMVGIEHLHSLAPVCQRFRQICQGDTLWKMFYDDFAPNDQWELNHAESQAKFFPWKTVFLINKIQDHAFGFGKFKLGEPPCFKGEKRNVKRLREIQLLKRNQDAVFPPRLIPLPMSLAQAKLFPPEDKAYQALQKEKAEKERKKAEEERDRRLLERYMNKFAGDSVSSTSLTEEPMNPNEFFDRMYPNGYNFYK